MRRFRNKPKLGTYAFVDSQNLNLGVQKAGWKLDWKKFRQYLADEYNVTQAYLFIGYIAENEAMYNQLHEAGYRIVLKPTIETSLPKKPDSKNPGTPGSPNTSLSSRATLTLNWCCMP